MKKSNPSDTTLSTHCSTNTQNIAEEKRVEPLTQEQAQTLAKCESTIEAGFQTFIEIGKALMTIKEGGLFRGGYACWDAYCRDRWKMSKTQANRLILAAQVVDTYLIPAGVAVRNEWQVRCLTSLSPVQLDKVIKKAQKAAEKKQQPLTMELIADNAPRPKVYRDYRKPRPFIPVVPPELKAEISRLEPAIQTILKNGVKDDAIKKVLDDVAAFLAQLQKEVA